MAPTARWQQSKEKHVAPNLAFERNEGVPGSQSSASPNVYWPIGLKELLSLPDPTPLYPEEE